MDLSISIKAVIVLGVVLQMSGSASQYLPSNFLQPPMPGAMPVPMGSVGPSMMMPSMQMQQPFLQRRLPIMVSPYHSKALDKKYMKRKKRRPRKYYSESESSSNSDSRSDSREYLRKPKHNRKKKRQVLTPVISYVTRNGQVVYQKKIKKKNAGDWLEMGSKKIPSFIDEAEEE
ncbi:unnamed protein product [Euphydryas editha]|uniref:Uncharacterized protein n=1 Tax=Euphydryas editha TaxID=104508 RepID=A0AAU9TMP5_EUPED|nr:unnamed protein product [Euphydryas editha]